ncbi:MAG: transglycosylase domain-containing protein [Pseudomonadota bacterium]
MTEEETTTTPLQYFGYRVKRDLAGAGAWFAERWRGGWLFKILAVLLGLAIAIWVAAWIWLASDLPEVDQLTEYETPLPTMVRGLDGEIVHSYERDRRVQLQYEDFPEQLIEAYISAEDKTFFTHSGVDVTGTMNAVVDYATKFGSDERAVGGSTITQQVAKVLLLGDEYSITRKLKEMILASRIEEAMTKEEILELYLNEIPLGRRSYGVQAASVAYFDKDVAELDLHEIAFLAILPKAPERYGRKDRESDAMARRAFVLEQMADNGFISEAERAAAQSQPLGLKQQRSRQYVEADYFIEEVRRELIAQFGETAEDGENSVYAGGLWVRTSLDPEMQEATRESLRKGLLKYHGSRGWAGAAATIDLDDGSWAGQLASSPFKVNYKDWRVGVVIERSGSRATVGFKDGEEAPLVGAPGAVKVGDVLAVRPSGNSYRVAIVPDAQGGMVVQNAQYGRVLAMQGGFDYGLSDFNRATQANRQPGSTIKPFVYAAGLDNGMTPSTKIDNSRYCYNQGGGRGQKCIRGGRGGESPLRYGLEQSQNIMTVQIGMQAGMDNVVDTIKAMDINDNPDPYAATTLGAEESTVLKMVNAYSAIANHGRLNKPTVIDYVQDRRGKVIYRADERQCTGCNMDEWDGQPMPRFGLKGRQAMDPRTAFQVMHMLEGVVDRGTATTLNSIDLPLFGKTGTTNQSKDVWFIGGTQRLIAGAYVGFDRPKPMGGYAQGGTIVAPIIKDFILATRDRWRVEPPVAPPGIRMVRVDRLSGKKVLNGWPTGDAKASIIWEAFKPDTEPERVTRSDQIAAKRDEILALIRSGSGAARREQQVEQETEQEDFVEEQGGIY